MHYLSCIDISYNELQGPISNSTTFKHAHMEGNKGLCGNVKGLPSCKAVTMHKQASRKKWFVVMFSSLVMVCRKRNLKNQSDRLKEPV